MLLQARWGTCAFHRAMALHWNEWNISSLRLSHQFNP